MKQPFITILVISFLLLFFSCKEEQNQSTNFLIIVVDNLGVNELISEEKEAIPTPHLDQLAQSAAVFSKAYSGSPDFSIAQKTLLSGSHTGQLASIPAATQSTRLFDLLSEKEYVTASYNATNLDLVNEFKSFINENKNQPFCYYVALKLPTEREAYGKQLTTLDQQIGSVEKLLQQKGLAENTVIIFTAGGGGRAGFIDALPNGELNGFAGDLHEGGIRVPMIIKWPKVIKSNRPIDRFIYFPDLFPTILGIAGYQQQLDKMNGISFEKFLKNPTTEEEDRFVYWESLSANKELQQIIRYRQWKMIRMDSKDPWKMYDLITDPNETDNVSAYHPGKMQKLQEQVEKIKSN